MSGDETPQADAGADAASEVTGSAEPHAARSTAREPTGGEATTLVRARAAVGRAIASDRVWHALALGGVLLALVLAILVFAKRRQGWDDRPVITGDAGGAHLLLRVDGLGPKAVPLGSRFEIQVRVSAQGEPAEHVKRLDDLDVRLVVPPHLLIVESKPRRTVPLDDQGVAVLTWTIEARTPGRSPLMVHARSARVGCASTWRLVVQVGSATAEEPGAEVDPDAGAPIPQEGMTLAMAVQTEGPAVVARGQPFEIGILVVNPGLSPGTALDLTDLQIDIVPGPSARALDDRLLHQGAPELTAGSTRVFPVQLVSDRSGRLEIRVTATASGGRARATGFFHVVVEAP